MSYFGIRTVISGGQTGSDQAGLVAAFNVNLSTGGWCPAEWRTNLGPMPLLEVLGVKCMDDHGYAARTSRNVLESDGTIIFGYDLSSPGSKLTARECAEAGKPCLRIEFPLPATGRDAVPVSETQRQQVESIVSFILKNEIETLNVAGNRDTDANLSNFKMTKSYLELAFKELQWLGKLQPWT